MTAAPVSDLWWLITRLRREHGKDHTVRPASHRPRGRHSEVRP